MHNFRRLLAGCMSLSIIGCADEGSTRLPQGTAKVAIGVEPTLWDYLESGVTSIAILQLSVIGANGQPADSARVMVSPLSPQESFNSVPDYTGKNGSLSVVVSNFGNYAGELPTNSDAIVHVRFLSSFSSNIVVKTRVRLEFAPRGSLPRIASLAVRQPAN